MESTLQKLSQLFSDKTKKEGQQRLYLTFLADIQKKIKNIRLYFHTHKLVTSAVPEQTDSLTEKEYACGSFGKNHELLHSIRRRALNECRADERNASSIETNFIRVDKFFKKIRIIRVRFYDYRRIMFNKRQSNWKL